MKIIIAGAGEVGRHLAKMLGSEHHEITIIDNDRARLDYACENADILAILGKPNSIQTLKAAAVDQCDLFVAVCPEKEQDINIITALLAKQMGAKKVTARINTGEYLMQENKLLFTTLGIDLLFYPEKIAAGEIVNLLKETEMAEFVSFSNDRLQMCVFKLDESSPLIDKTPGDFPFENDIPFRTMAITRSENTIIPTKETKFRLHDLLYVIARKDGVDAAMKFSGKSALNIKSVTILGGNSIGELLAEQLEDRYDSVKIIEQDRNLCMRLSQKLSKTLVINGDGRNSDFLMEENISGNDAFVAVTPSSETNILACVQAKKMGVSKTIAEVENLEYIRLAEGMGVDAVINKKLITASRIFRFTLSNKVRTIKCLSGSNAEVIEYIANPGSMITKKPLRSIDLPQNAIVGGITRGSESFIAVGDTLIKPYDRVVVFALPDTLSKIDKYFL